MTDEEFEICEQAEREKHDKIKGDKGTKWKSIKINMVEKYLFI